jgi:hypothetical protein
VALRCQGATTLDLGRISHTRNRASQILSADSAILLPAGIALEFTSIDEETELGITPELEDRKERRPRLRPGPKKR